MQFEDASVDIGKSYWYRLVLRLSDGSEILAGPVRATVPEHSSRTVLYTPIEVPADGPVRIRYGIGPSQTHARLAIYNVSGRRVRSLALGVQEPGDDVALWDRREQSGNRVPRGVYWVQLETQVTRVATKVSLVTQ